MNGYASIDNIGTYLLLAVPAYTKVTFEKTTFNNVFSFNYQLYTSPWSQLGRLAFESCTFNGLIVGSIASTELAFDGCTFTDYRNAVSANNSNPTWIRPAYGNWTKDDNEGQGTGFRSLTSISFTGNTVTSTRPVKFERIAQWEMETTVTVTENAFDVTPQEGDTSPKNVGLYFGANAKFDLVADKNTKSDGTAALYTAAYKAPNGTDYDGLPTGSTVKNATGADAALDDARVWKKTDVLTLKTTEEAASVTNAKGVSVAFATLADALAAAQDGETVTLLADVAEDVAVGKSVTLDLGGKTLTNAGAWKVTLTIASGATVAVKNGRLVGGASNYTIQNKGTAIFEDVTATAGAGNVVSSMLDNFGTLTINSGNYSGGLNVVKSEEGTTLLITGGTFTLGSASSAYYTAVLLVYGDTTITGGTFIQNATGKWINAQVVMTGVVDGYTSITKVKGGTFVNNATRTTCKIFHGIGNATSDNFEVSGGTFNKEVPENYCAEGYEPVTNRDGTSYGVKATFEIVTVKTAVGAETTINVRIPNALMETVAGETLAEKVENLSKADENGNLAWVNLVAGIESTKKVTMAAPQNGNADVIDVALPAVGTAPAGTDVTVRYEIRAEGSDAAVVSATAAKNLEINLDGQAGIGTYRTYVCLLQNETEVARVASENALGVLQTVSAAKKTIIAVPWLSLTDGNAIAVADLVKTAGLTRATNCMSTTRPKAAMMSTSLRRTGHGCRRRFTRSARMARSRRFRPARRRRRRWRAVTACGWSVRTRRSRLSSTDRSHLAQLRRRSTRGRRRSRHGISLLCRQRLQSTSR